MIGAGVLRVTGEIDAYDNDRLRRILGAAPELTRTAVDVSAAEYIDHRTLLALQEVSQPGNPLPRDGPTRCAGPRVATARRGRTGVGVLLMTATGYVHEIGLYGSDEEFRAIIEPFARDGLADGEPVVFAYEPHKRALLQQWLPDSPQITYITDVGPYATPAKALGSWRALVSRHLDAGASRVRIAGDVPHEGYGRPYAGWDRYEAAVDRALGDLPVWAPCLYDRRIAPESVVARALALHRRVLTNDGGHVENQDFHHHGSLADFLPPPADPLEATAPLIDVLGPGLGAARAAVKTAGAGLLAADVAHALLLAVSETLTNAYQHGQAPVRLRLWADAGRVVVEVHDAGPGPSDPLVGLFGSPSSDEAGRGLWLTHCLDLDVALRGGDDGFTVRIRAGELD